VTIGYNPSYLELRFKASLGKKLAKLHFNQ
jgi:hypothetical protein